MSHGVTENTANLTYSGESGGLNESTSDRGLGRHDHGGVAHNSPTCNGSSVTGIGRDAAQKIWYRALTVYMTSSTNYAGARAATLSAAADLGYSTSAVAAAWSAVSVN